MNGWECRVTTIPVGAESKSIVYLNKTSIIVKVVHI